jgi:hypothetical protein
MNAVRSYRAEEQWIELPKPNLDRYMLHSRRRAANDNRRGFLKGFGGVQVITCMALMSVVTLLVL